jgi:hypothetical protein
MHKNVADAVKILTLLGVPPTQVGEQTALCLLAVLDMQPNKRWRQAQAPLIGITPIIEWIAKHYGRRYAPNTRETIRKSAMHVFVSAGIVHENPDKPDRPVNSPKWVYQINPVTLDLIRTFGSRDWNLLLKQYLAEHPRLVERYSRAREILRVPIRLAENIQFSMSPGKHSDLIRSVIEEFGSRFIPDGELVYVGDTGSKWGFFNESLLSSLGVTVGEHGIMPDVVIFCQKRKWLVLVEAVVSSGPVSPRRHEELKKLFKESEAGLVFVTAFPDEKLMRKFLGEIAWETEVWRADAPTHLIHFNGERFLGPY